MIPKKWAPVFGKDHAHSADFAVLMRRSML
jgi:hypothetical protein